jgi:hypothetical protein
MKIHPEQPALDAVNELTMEEKKYPYAASMLIYLIIERELKDYVMEHKQLYLNKKLNSRPAVYGNDLTETGFDNVVQNLTLGSLEALIGIKGSPTKPSANRNALMHSKGYRDRRIKDRKNSSMKDKDAFATAKKDLIWVFEKYSSFKVSNKEGRLVFEFKKIEMVFR